jgi:peptide deformylase
MTAMSIRPILIHPDPRLKKVADAVPDLSDDLRLLADDMLETMYDAPGVGLAAPQIGVLTRLIVADPVKDPNAAPKPMIMFNPEILLSSDDTSVYEEGCLSIPEQYAEVTRPAEVRIRWIDRNGNEHEADFAGFTATVLQHEIDHLNGKLFIDYLSPMKRQMMTRKSQKMKRERTRA